MKTLVTTENEQAANEPSAADLLSAVDAELATSDGKLQFAPALEAKYEADTSQTLNQHFFRAGLIAVAMSDSFLLSDYLNRPELLWDIFWVRLLVVTIPCLAIVFVVRNGVSAESRDRMSIIGIWLVSFATALINQWTTSDFASYDIFIFSLITVASNILLPMRFKTALVASTGALLIMQSMVFIHPHITFDAKVQSVMIFVSATIFTLFSRYQLEIAQRVNYLNMLRSNLQKSLALSDNAELVEISNTDSLTGLPNRRKFLAAYDALKDDPDARSGIFAGVLMIDIDYFKVFNDTFGHLDGDRCLAQVASIIASSLQGEGELAARLGGEEFAVLLPATDIAGIGRTAERIRRNVANARIPHDGATGRKYVTVSVGFTLTALSVGEDAREVMKRADEALYNAKDGGRNRVVEQLTGNVA